MATEVKSLLALSLAVLFACGSGDEYKHGVPSGNAGGEMPSLEEVVLSVASVDLPFREPSHLALTATGYLAIPVRPDQAGMYVVVDSSGKMLRRIVQEGEGPGESWTGVAISGDSVFAYSAYSPPFFQVFRTDGELLAERRIPPMEGFVQPLVGDSIDISFGIRSVGYGGRVVSDVRGPIVRTCLYEDCSRTLLPGDDSILRIVHLATPRKGGQRWPPYAAEPGRFVLGEGVTYRLWYFDDATGRMVAGFGRDIEPRRLTARERADEKARLSMGAPGYVFDTAKVLEQIEREPLPHFGYRNLAFDWKHRLWVMGTANDSVFLDVFSDTTFLGRLKVDCLSDRRTFALRGHWLAMSCLYEDDLEEPVRVRLFRILQ